MAINPKILDVLKILSEVPAKAAMIAPTIITDEIALVTDINGVWSDGGNTPYNIITNKDR